MQNNESPTIESAVGSGGTDPDGFIFVMLAAVAWSLIVATAAAVVSYDTLWIQVHRYIDH